MREDPRRALLQPAEGLERMPDVRRQELARGGRVGETAAHEHLRGDVRDPEPGAQPLGGGVVVRGDLESDVGRRHARTVRRRADGPDPAATLSCKRGSIPSAGPVNTARAAPGPGGLARGGETFD